MPTANSRAARLLGEVVLTLTEGQSAVMDCRGFSTIRASISSGSSGGSLTVSRVNAQSATADPSSAVGGLETVTGSSVGASTSITVDWPFYRVVLSTGSTGAPSAYLARS